MQTTIILSEHLCHTHTHTQHHRKSNDATKCEIFYLSQLMEPLLIMHKTHFAMQNYSLFIWMLQNTWDLLRIKRISWVATIQWDESNLFPLTTINNDFFIEIFSKWPLFSCIKCDKQNRNSEMEFIHSFINENEQ